MSHILLDSSGISIVHDPVEFLLVSEPGSPLGGPLDSDTWPPVGIHFIVVIPSGSKVRYPEFLGSPSRATLTVPPSISCSKFPPHPSGKCPTSPSQDTISATLSTG